MIKATAVAIWLLVLVGDKLPLHLRGIPPMGWAIRSTSAEEISDQIIVDTVSKMKELGLNKVGYVYVDMQDGWA